MAEQCRGCFSGEVRSTDSCPGLLGTITVGTATEVFFVQTCPNPERQDQAETFIELQRNGVSVIVAYETTPASPEEATVLARAHQL